MSEKNIKEDHSYFSCFDFFSELISYTLGKLKIIPVGV